MRLPKIGFAKRFLIVYSFVFVAVLILTDWSLSRVLEKRNLEQLKDSLFRQSSLVRETIVPNLRNTTLLQEQIRQLAQITDARVTIIDPAGRVLADSKESAEEVLRMDDHATRPEVAAALRKGTGTSIRYSMTLRTEMLYVAVPILDGQELLGVARLAIPVARVDRILSAARKPVYFSALIGILIILLAGGLFANYLTKRIRKITSVAERFAKEDWSQKVLISGNDELKLLADTMNHMAAKLQGRIKDLEAEKGKIAAILNHMAEAVIAIDRRKQIVTANPTAEILFGFKLDAVRGKSLIEATRHPQLERIVDRAFREQKPLEDEIQLSSKSRNILRVSVVMLDQDVQHIGSILVFYDITELRRLENVRREFVANASHELRTPLTSISGFIETLLGGAIKDADAGEKFLRIMQEDTTRLGRLVDDLLMLGEIEQGASPLKKDDVDLTTELRAIVERFRSQLEAKSIVLEDCLPATGTTVRGDRDKIRQVFVNLFDNAIKFNHREGRIVLTAAQDPKGVQVSFEDTGIGIPKEALGRIFERFFRVDKARSRDLGGTGLGLAIVKHIMEAHGGRASCESVPGQGSRFVVFFPAR